METQIQPSHFIDKVTFKNWTDAWKAAGNSDHKIFFFKENDYFQTKAWLPNECVLFFLSTVGVVTVKVRFGIDNDNQFRVILYGVDQKNQLITPYYCLQKYYRHIHEEINIDDPLSTPLVKNWILNWLDLYNKRILRKMFMVYFDELLEGYNYPFREILDAFQPALVDSEGVVNIYFALHSYPRRNADGEIVLRNTFGIVFQASSELDPNSSHNSEKSAESNPYFDVTTPCPQTC